MANRDSQKAKVRVASADGVKGCIIDSPISGPFFRVYNEDYTFTDFAIFHSDMFVTIADEDAYFYFSEDGTVSIDHSPETLGLDPGTIIRS